MDKQTINSSQWSTIAWPPCAVILAALACLPAESALQLYGFNWAGGPQWPQVDATAEARAVGGLQTAGLLRVHPTPCQGAPSLPYRAKTPSLPHAVSWAPAGCRTHFCTHCCTRRRIGSPPDTRARKLAIGYGGRAASAGRRATCM